MKQILFLIISVLLFSCCAADDEEVKKNIIFYPDTSWTFMFYFGADNDLEYHLLRNIKQMKESYTGNVNVVFLIDRSSSYSSDSKILGENFSGIRVFQMLPGGILHVLNESSFQDDESRAFTLKKFIKLGKEKFPAEHYALFIGSHGGGARSTNRNIIYSESNESWVYTHEFSDVLSADESVDVLALDACFMGNLEFLYQIRPDNGSFQTDFAVASAPTEWSYGWNYRSLFAAIAKYKSCEITPLLLGKIILENHRNYTQTEELDDQVLSLFDMRKIKDVKNAVDNLFVAAKDMKDQLCALRGYGSLVQSDTLHYFDSSNPYYSAFEWLEYCYFDLYDIALKVKDYENLSELAQTLMEAMEQAVICSFAGSYFKRFVADKSGLSIFFPDGDRLYDGIPMWEAQKWYNAKPVENQGNLAFCRDGAVEGNKIIENYFEVLDYWFDSVSERNVNDYEY